MLRKMSSIHLIIWKPYVYFALIVYLYPTVSSFPKETHSLDSKLASRFKEGALVYNEEEKDLAENADCTCINGKCVLKEKKLVCECPPDYGYFTSSYCKACNCGKGFSCTFEPYGFLSTKTRTLCNCTEGYKAVDEKCVGPCTQNPCKNGGRCTDIENGYKCVCKSGFIGKNCADIDPCSRAPCKNNGICKVENNTFACFCKQPYYGYTCEEDSCSKNPCLNNGICKMENEKFVCFCRYPFYGKKCEKDYDISTIGPTALPSTRSPVIEYSRNISFETTYEPSIYYNQTEKWNTTSEATLSSYEPTKEYNTTVEPSGFTLDFNVTSEVYENFTNSDNHTFEPWNTTLEYSTTEESSNHTQTFTTEEFPSNITTGFNLTSEGPLDFTLEYNKTTDFRDNLNITTALPIETTSIDDSLTSVTASTSKPVMYIFRNVYTIQNLTELVVKT